MTTRNKKKFKKKTTIDDILVFPVDVAVEVAIHTVAAIPLSISLSTPQAVLEAGDKVIPPVTSFGGKVMETGWSVETGDFVTGGFFDGSFLSGSTELATSLFADAGETIGGALSGTLDVAGDALSASGEVIGEILSGAGDLLG